MSQSSGSVALSDVDSLSELSTSSSEFSTSSEDSPKTRGQPSLYVATKTIVFNDNEHMVNKYYRYIPGCIYPRLISNEELQKYVARKRARVE